MKLINAPIMRIFHLNINAPNRTAFVNEGKHNMMTSIKNEPGTLFMLAGHDDKLGESNYVIECYQDEEHYQIHAKSIIKSMQIHLNSSIMVKRLKRSLLVLK